MFGSRALEVAVGLASMYALLSLGCSWVLELIAATRRLRAHTLRASLQVILGAEAQKKLYESPLIVGLRGPRDEDPAYIKGTLFGRALLETFAPVGDGGLAKALVASIDDKRIRSLLHSLASDSKMTVDALCREIGRWFDEAMISATAEYRRSAQWRLLGIALVATVAMNVDTRAVAQALWSDGSALDTPLPLGWSGDVLRDGPGQWLLRIAGWLLTAIATALGAPFWFELMTRLMRLRSETRSEPSPKGESAP